jgi:hypothetical protein
MNFGQHRLTSYAVKASLFFDVHVIFPLEDSSLSKSINFRHLLDHPFALVVASYQTGFHQFISDGPVDLGQATISLLACLLPLFQHLPNRRQQMLVGGLR